MPEKNKILLETFHQKSFNIILNLRKIFYE